MHIAILTFEGFNELDSLIALGVLNRVKTEDWRVTIATPTPRVTSMNGVVVEQMSSLEEAVEADVVVVRSGIAIREVVEDPAIMDVVRRLDPAPQLIAGQCSGALVLARLGLLTDMPACTALISRPRVVAAGVKVLNQPFFARDNLATAGGCQASHYLAGWLISRLVDREAAEGALRYVAPCRREAGVRRPCLAPHDPLPAHRCPGTRLGPPCPRQWIQRGRTCGPKTHLGTSGSLP